MRDIKGSTSEEIRMIKAIQRSVGALDNGWIGKRRCIAERAEIILSNLAQDTAHDLAGTGFWQAGRKLDLVR